jgi:RNA polymerase sigma-70 factor (ECF subfamily)
LLADKDRGLWDHKQIEAGQAALERAIALGGHGVGGVYVLQAAIASLHVEEICDWPHIVALYGELSRLTGSPVVELNRAVALAEADGLQAGLEAIDQLEGLDSYHYFHAVRADLLRRLDRTEEARTSYERSLELVHNDPERRFLASRLAELK